ncbi:uncharacterized protein A4U43_C09F16570 [Asparagus officinalis]|uniref:Uncharacterized protein n=1 Tax=Asparagus officinalis TaxID=4686 RepID=A0A5P1E893_ASPOF|nr:uncharacterized protein A4U43_C09F16570 [Asparagus officinalis]
MSHSEEHSLFLLGSSSVESLSDAEYSKLTSVRSVISELRERLQSHSMKSYRSRFQRIYDQLMYVHASTFLGIEQLPEFPQLQKWLGLTAGGAVELGHIVDPPVIRAAWSWPPSVYSCSGSNKWKLVLNSCRITTSCAFTRIKS